MGYTFNPFSGNFDKINKDAPTRAEWDVNGFENRTDSSLTWTDTSPDRTLSIQPTATSFDYWVAGVKYTSTGDTYQITDTEGIWVIYYDGATLTGINNPTTGQVDSIIRTKAIASIIYWDSSEAEAIYVGEERHGKNMSSSTHAYLHFIDGLAYLSGLGLNTMSVDGTGTTADAQFGVDSGAVTDEDLYKDISAVTSTTGLPIYYMLGASAEWQKHTEAGFSVRTYDGTSADRLAYNQYTGGAWQLTEVASNDFVLCHIFATTEKDTPMIAIMGQEDYANKVAARAGAKTEIHSLVLDDVLFPEIRPIATVIFQTNTSYANDVNAKVVSTSDGDDYIDWRSEVISRVEISTSNHGDLTGLADDDHTQYFLADGTRTITGNINGQGYIAIGNTAQVDGTYGTALGNYARATGVSSVALGQNSRAYSDYSIAMNNNAFAIGDYSMAFGEAALTSANYAIALGNNINASGAKSMALGTKLNVSGTSSFGIGLDETVRTLSQANSMAIMGGNVGIGNLTPSTALDVTGVITATGGTSTEWNLGYDHISANGSSHSYIDQDVTSGSSPTFSADNFSDGGSNAIVTTTQETNWDNHIADNSQAHSDYMTNNGDTATGNYKISGSLWMDGTTGDTPTSGAGTRLMWIPSKAAFRAGKVTSTQWNAGNIGSGSIGLGEDTSASGLQSISIGKGCSATATQAITIGTGNATGGNSVVIGSGSATASAIQSVAIGSSAVASGTQAIGMGFGCEASGETSFTCGYNSNAKSTSSFAGGYGSDITGTAAFGYGSNCKTTGDYSQAWGKGSYARQKAHIAFANGKFEVNYDAQVTKTILRGEMAASGNSDIETTDAFDIPEDMAIGFNLSIVLRADDGTCAYARRMCLLENIGGTTALVGAAQTIGTDIDPDSMITSITITADNTNDEININVNSGYADDVGVVIYVQAIENGFTKPAGS